jgi:hypothetical protein
LTTLILPDTVEVIDERCFAGCCNLKRVVFKNPCTAVYRDAFSGCDSLDEDSKSALNDHIYNIW